MVTTSPEKSSRWQEIHSYWQDYTLTYRVMGILILIALGIWIFGRNLLDFEGDMLAYATNVFTEGLSIVVTIAVFNHLSQQREKRDQDELQKRLDEQELTRLKALLGSNENVVTKIAVAELRAKGWLMDGSLRGSKIVLADLRSTYLGSGDLERTIISACDLQGSDLTAVNLQYSYLRHSNFKKASLILANLQNTNMYAVICDKNTILPDGSYWTSKTDWSKFGAVEIEDWNDWQAYLKEHGMLDENE